MYMNRTRKNKKQHIQGEVSASTQGWRKIRVYGDPYERGYAHGYLLARELKPAKQTLTFIVREFLKMDVSDYMKRCKNEIGPIVKNKYPELYNELRGISAGAGSAGTSVSLAFLIAWNSLLSLYPRNVAPNRCSAFIATGSATESGEIVMAHNTHTDFVSGSRLNIIIHVEPNDGHSFVMQTAPGYIASSTDWFLCSSGIIGCETTIAKVNFEPDFKKGHTKCDAIRENPG